MITLEQLRAQYKPQILALAAKHGVENIRVFGSVARGEADVMSDVDFLYSMRPAFDLWEAAGMYGDLEETLPFRFDFVCDENLRPHVKQIILSEAVPL